VLAHRSGVIADGHPVQTFAGEVAELHPKLVAAGLVDQMVVTYAPCSLGSGVRVLPIRSEWVLREVDRNAEFVCARWAKAG
jgi:hypothetical protein